MNTSVIFDARPQEFDVDIDALQKRLVLELTLVPQKPEIDEENPETPKKPEKFEKGNILTGHRIVLNSTTRQSAHYFLTYNITFDSSHYVVPYGYQKSYVADEYDITLSVPWPNRYENTFFKKRVNQYMQEYIHKFETSLQFPVRIRMHVLVKNFKNDHKETNITIKDMHNIPQIVVFPDFNRNMDVDGITYARTAASFENERKLFSGLGREGLCFLFRILLYNGIVDGNALAYLELNSNMILTELTESKIREWGLREKQLYAPLILSRIDLYNFCERVRLYFIQEGYDNAAAEIAFLQPDETLYGHNTKYTANLVKVEQYINNDDEQRQRMDSMRKGEKIMKIITDHFNTIDLVGHFQHIGFNKVPLPDNPKMTDYNRQIMSVTVLSFLHKCDEYLLNRNK